MILSSIFIFFEIGLQCHFLSLLPQGSITAFPDTIEKKLKTKTKNGREKREKKSKSKMGVKRKEKRKKTKERGLKKEKRDGGE